MSKPGIITSQQQTIHKKGSIQNIYVLLQHTSSKAVRMSMGIDMTIRAKMQKEAMKLKQRNVDIRNLVSLLIAE